MGRYKEIFYKLSSWRSWFMEKKIITYKTVMTQMKIIHSKKNDEKYLQTSLQKLSWHIDGEGS